MHAKKSVIVTGDVTADWNIVRRTNDNLDNTKWNFLDITRACLQPGGAAMLSILLEKLRKNYLVWGCKLPPRLSSPADNRSYHSYVMWKPYPSKKGDKQMVWRVESFLGLDPNCGQEHITQCKIPRPGNIPETADIVVIDDAALLFRSSPQFWPAAITRGTPQWIVIKMAHPVGEDNPGTLWNLLLERHAERIILITSLTDLRKCSVRISKGLSWERTAQELLWEIKNNPCVESLRCCAHTVITLGTAGAFLYSVNNVNLPGDAHLLYDPGCFEGTWGEEYPGSMVGYNVCATAAIVRELVNSPDPTQPLLREGIRRGIHLARRLQIIGYGPVDKKEDPGVMLQPVFPAQELAAAYAETTGNMFWSKVPDPAIHLKTNSAAETRDCSQWTILDDVCRDWETARCVGGTGLFYYEESEQMLLEMAERIVRHGYEKTLLEVPTARYGKLVTADRTEIEAYNNIALMIQQYCRKPMAKPLCLAVFGSPGSGKSFGVKQVARSISDNIVEITFNVSQLTTVKDLCDALQQVRDIGLGGKIPLVFWDEFDDREFVWLRSFLAPMQDGVFQDGQLTYHVGSAIFVFAGGTSASLDDFQKKLKDTGKEQLLKGPDFISRLHNVMTVLGPNPIDQKTGGDRHYLIRRAILLRGIISASAKHLLKNSEVQIDPGVLRAFLKVRKYHHGARSMESIVLTSLLAGKSRYDKSCLPPKSQLDIHVNEEEFFFAINEFVDRKGTMTKDKLDILAAGVHEVYCENADTWQTEAARLKFAELDEGLKEENRRNVQDILHKLSTIGYVAVRADANQQPEQLPEEVVEVLGEMEHLRWMRSKISLGWTYAPQRDNQARRHPCLLPWRDVNDEDLARMDARISAAIGRTALPELEKEKDRVLVRAIPRILAMADMVLKKL